jgi:hypothetical protein
MKTKLSITQLADQNDLAAKIEARLDGSFLRREYTLTDLNASLQNTRKAIKLLKEHKKILNKLEERTLE